MSRPAEPAALVYVDEETGEMIEASPAAEITATDLLTYAKARVASDAAQLALAERMQELMRDDPLAAELSAKVDAARVTVAGVEAGLEAAWTSAFRKRLNSGISIDFGFARVTWPKPSETWSMTVKPAEIEKQYPEMAQLLGVSSKIGKPAAPRVTIRAEKLAQVLR